MAVRQLWHHGGKRIVDVLASALALVALGPVLLALAVLVRSRLGTPVLFRHVRPGRHGEPFTLLKFRTMTEDRDAAGTLLPDDERLTSFGAWLRSTSLDELPELVNVLRGDMSLVGPRPLLTSYLQLYSREQSRRHEVRPGLTGWAQVNGRNATCWDARLAMDVWYVDNLSLRLDAQIVLRTVLTVLGRDGITSDGHATVPRFSGPATSAGAGELIDQGSGLPRPAGRGVDAPGASTVRTPTSGLSEGRCAEGDEMTSGPRAETDHLTVRAATADDRPAVLALLEASLGWVPDDQYAAFFEWKHERNPFGASRAWVALDGDRVVGFRTWMRWTFEDAGRRWSAVRAVDTATHPEYQGRGVFRRLTTSSIDALRADRVDFVFNTPNEQSRPGYLKMGWEEIGTLPVRIRLRGPRAVLRMAQSRVPAEKWSVPCTGGVRASTALADGDTVRALLASRGPATRLRTAIDLDVLRWRYGFADLHYRAVATSDGDGMAFFRVRRRGAATEAVVGHVLATDAAHESMLLRRIAQVSGADYALRISDDPIGRAAYLPLPRQGPVLTWRSLVRQDMPALDEWDLCMGDVELF